MKSRQWSTRVKRIPNVNDINSVNKIVAVLIKDNNDVWNIDEFKSLWLLDCIIYVAIVAWYLINGIKLIIKKTSKLSKDEDEA